MPHLGCPRMSQVVPYLRFFLSSFPPLCIPYLSSMCCLREDEWPFSVILIIWAIAEVYEVNLVNSAFLHTDFMAGMPFLIFFSISQILFGPWSCSFFLFSLVCAVYLNPALHPPPLAAQAPPRGLKTCGRRCSLLRYSWHREDFSEKIKAPLGH